MEDVSKYSHSPAHFAVLRRDHMALRRLVSTLPRLPKAGEVTTEAESIAGELTADAVSAVIDRRDVPNRETPLHLAVRLRDPTSAEILMSAGADWSLQNGHGWSALQEAVCSREESIAMIIARHYQPLAWAKWCRRLPRIISSISRIRDFYMEITFHFESSVIPFIGRIAPSDTYRIWKRGSNLRADMTLAGFDGFRIQRSDQTFMFLGEGVAVDSNTPELPPGSLIVLAHKEKEITNALEGAGAKPTEAEVAHEVALMSQTNMYRPGIDVTQAELVPHLNWRRQERTEMVGNWKGKVYDMLHVMVSVKSRRVPGAMTDEELFAVDGEERSGNGMEHENGLDDVLTAEERKQLDCALKMENSEEGDEEMNGDSLDSFESNGVTKEKKSWFGWNSKRASKANGEDVEDLRSHKKSSKLVSENGHVKYENGKEELADVKKGKEKSSGKKKKNGVMSDSNKLESEYKKGLRPVLWLTPDFPLKTDELLPLLDVLANKVKAVRRLRELLTTKLPQGTFPVKRIDLEYTSRMIIKYLKDGVQWDSVEAEWEKMWQQWGDMRNPYKMFSEVAIPIVPTIRVIITFTKFEELQPLDEFSTPLSSPTHFQESKSKDIESSSSWYSWVKGNHRGQSSDSPDFRSSRDEPDPFHIPSDYTWVDANEKKKRMKAKKAKTKRGASKKQTSRNTESSPQLMDGFED